MEKGKRVGICLSGGGALGFAHIGVLRAFEEIGIKPSVISGASMGALIGVFYASGMNSSEICRMVKDEKAYKLLGIFKPSRISPKKGIRGLSSHKHLRILLEKRLPFNDFESLKLPFGISVSNISSQSVEYISSGGNLKEYVLASMSLPAVFNPIVIDGNYYIDGGFLDNFPASIFRDQCDILIGVDVHPVRPATKMSSILDFGLRSLQTLVHNNSIPGRSLCNYLIEPPSLEQFNLFDFQKFTTIYHIGYREAVSFINNHPELKSLSL